MKLVIQITRTVGAMILIAGLCASPVMASVIYHYTGKNYTTSNSGGVDFRFGPIIGSIRLSSALSSNLVDFAVGPDEFSFLDPYGAALTEVSTYLVQKYFRITTNAGGQITDWNISIHQFSTSGGRFIDTTGSGDLGKILTGPCVLGGSCLSAVGAFNSNSPGVWSVEQVGTNNSVPTPGTLPLLAVAGLALAVANRSRAHKRFGGRSKLKFPPLPPPRSACALP